MTNYIERAGQISKKAHHTIEIHTDNEGFEVSLTLCGIGFDVCIEKRKSVVEEICEEMNHEEWGFFLWVVTEDDERQLHPRSYTDYDAACVDAIVELIKTNLYCYIEDKNAKN